MTQNNNLELSKKSLQTSFTAVQTANAKLQYEFDYLRQHIDISALPKAEGALRSLQLRNVSFGKEFSLILAENNMNAFLSNGALIGYLRHNKGFCPWNDSLNFGLIAQNFWLLIDLIKNKALKNSFGYEVVHLDFCMLKNKDSKEKNESDPIFWTLLEKAFLENPDSIIAIQSPYSLQLYKGESLANHARIDILPWYYWNSNLTAKDYYAHAKDIRAKVSLCKLWKDVFNLYEKERLNTRIYSEKSDHIAVGIGNDTFINWKFSGFYTQNQIFPLKEIDFEDTKFFTLNDIETYLKNTYGNYELLPSDLGVTMRSSVVKQYFDTRNQDEAENPLSDMFEAKVCCKHVG